MRLRFSRRCSGTFGRNLADESARGCGLVARNAHDGALVRLVAWMILAVAEAMAHALMVRHGIGDWSLRWTDARRVFGACSYRTRSIKLSRELVRLNGLDEVENVILHEIAHALAGWQAAHGPHWVRVARELGCDGTRCYGTEVERPQGAWQLRCLKCAFVEPRYKESKIERWTHRGCGGKMVMERTGTTPNQR